MKTSQIWTVGLVAGALVIGGGTLSFAQHSSGGTSPSVTEDKGTQSGNKSGDQSVVPSRETSGTMSPSDRMIQGDKPFNEGTAKGSQGSTGAGGSTPGSKGTGPLGHGSTGSGGTGSTGSSGSGMGSGGGHWIKP
jgi:hypothetical protein